VRQVVPTLARRHQSYTYAEQRCVWLIDGHSRLLEASVCRFALSASDMLHRGFIAFDARGRALRSGGCSVTLRIAGAGPLHQPGDIDHSLAALGLEAGPNDGDDTRDTQLKRAHGKCPATQARVEFAGLPLAGFIFSAIYTLRDALPAPADEHNVVASSTGSLPRLWILQPDSLNAASVTAQGQSHGWAVSAFTSAMQVRRRLRSLSPPQARPGMFVCFVRDAASAEEAIALSKLLPQSTHRIGAVEIDAEWIISPELSERYELSCHPFCHDDWVRWTATWALRSDEGSGTTSPAPLSSDERISVLVVDDDEFARELTCVQVSSLGYDCIAASSGRDAIDLCRTDGPSLVLMDLEMPGLDGFDTTRQLRALQRAGQIAPCRILAYSSLSGVDAIRQALLAGADTFLAKPIPTENLRAELQRWSAGRLLSGPLSWDRALAPRPLSS